MRFYLFGNAVDIIQTFVLTAYTFVILMLLIQIPLAQTSEIGTPQTLLHKNIVHAAELPAIVMHGDRNTPKIALTFDADMTPWMKQQLDIGAVRSYYGQRTIQDLEESHTKATLFLTGLWIEAYPETAKQLGQNPLFELGNHSYEHYSFDGSCYGLSILPDDQKMESITKTIGLLKTVVDVQDKFFRFPGGCYNDAALKTVHEAGLIPIQWDVAADDGFNDNGQSIIDKVLSQTQNGSIIVLHMNGVPNEPQTANVLPEIIQKLKDKGFEFVTMSELLAEPVENIDNDLMNSKSGVSNE